MSTQTLPRDFRLEVAQRKLARRRRRQDALASCSGDVRAVRLVNESGGQLFVHPSTYPEHRGEWQLTTFSPDGRPWGHTNAPTFREAILRAVGASDDSYWNEYGYTIAEVVN